MSLYGNFRYSQSQYGGNQFNLPSGGPAGLTAYQNNISTIILYWELLPVTTAAILDSFIWIVQTDTDSSFSSPNLRTYTTSDLLISLAGPLITGNTISVAVDGTPASAVFTTDNATTLAAFAVAIAALPNVASATVSGNSVLVHSSDIQNPVVLTLLSITGGASQTTGTINPSVYSPTNPGQASFIRGQVNTGISVPAYTRLQGETLPMYWQVTGRRGGSNTTTSGSTFIIPKAIDQVSRDAMLALMPDPVYKKDPGSNNFGILWSYGQALDDAYVAGVLVNNDTYTASIRDATIQAKFGDLVQITRPPNMKAIDFREIIRVFLAEARSSPTMASVIEVVDAALGLDPVIINIRDIMDLQVADDSSSPVVEAFYVEDLPNGVLAPTIWNNTHLAGGVIVEVTNPLLAFVSQDFLQKILRKLVLANYPLYVVGIP